MLVAAFALLAMLSPAPPGASSAARHVRRPAVHHPASLPITAGDLYSARAKRRIAAYLRMRLGELRLRSLERAADVVEHRLSLEELLKTP